MLSARRKLAMRVAVVGSLLFATTYLVLPVVSGALEIGDRLGPRIYPVGLHSFLYLIGWELTDHQAVKPRIPFGSPGNRSRPWFYGLEAPSFSPPQTSDDSNEH
ncbi:MAG: hypothetical protein WD534_16295 [Phycisphaeraceae bacterium]